MSKTSNPGKLFSIDKEAKKYYPKSKAYGSMPTLTQFTSIIVRESEWPYRKFRKFMQAA